MTQEELKMELEELAVRFSEGWHEGIKIDASDIMLLNEAAQALAQPEQEPVGYVYSESGVKSAAIQGDVPNGTPLYTAPPQRKPLTDDLYNELLFAVENKYTDETRHQTALRYIKQAEMPSARPAQAAHGIKENT